MARRYNTKNLVPLHVEINKDIYEKLNTESINTGDSKAEITETALKQYLEEKSKRKPVLVEYPSSVQFLMKSENKKQYAEKDVRISVMGTERSPIVKFSFTNDSLDMILGGLPYEYISVSVVDKDTKTIYFDGVNKEEGFKIDNRGYGGTITIGNRYFCQNIVKNKWAGDYNLEYSKEGYWCINKIGE